MPVEEYVFLRVLSVCVLIRRLRDKLIADERLSLAMEVSTKCGIDPAGVWSAMGFACLHLGDFLGARDKFAHCLKVRLFQEQIYFIKISACINFSRISCALL